MLCHVTVTGDAREDATLKTARTARVAGAMRIIVGAWCDVAPRPPTKWHASSSKGLCPDPLQCWMGGRRVTYQVLL